MFIPTTKSEIMNLHWDSCDIILVTGDTYIDSPYDGTALLGKWLIKHGFKVGIIAQPDVFSHFDITRLGSPNLFWGVSGGCVDSMVANYTATKKKRHIDDLTPGSDNNKRPDRAVIKYVNLIKQYFKSAKPVVIGGIESSLRRVAHYDYWDESIRRSILFDSKADYLLYGMAENSILQIAEAIRDNGNVCNIHGLSYISSEPVNDYIELPSYEEVRENHNSFAKMFDIFYNNCEPYTAKGLIQKTGDRYLVQNPPGHIPSSRELDSFYDLEFEYDAHPYYKSQGIIKALETTRQSVTSHRGCFGECNFCAIAVHQGRTVISRSEKSIIEEVDRIMAKPGFNGIIYDVGGPTANMYGMQCQKQIESGSCTNKRCTFPNLCKSMNINHDRYIKLLNKIRNMKGISKVFVKSGLRFDLIIKDKENGDNFIRLLAEHYVSGQLKIAPEHISDETLNAMGKNKDKSLLLKFKEAFMQYSQKVGKKQYLTYYFIACHPGSTISDMMELKRFLKEELKANPEQVQIFTPSPSTYSTLMYHTGKNCFNGKPIYVEKQLKRKQVSKDIITMPQWKFKKKRN